MGGWLACLYIKFCGDLICFLFESMSLYLGKEIFEIEPQRIMDHNHLYIRQGAALQAQAIFAQKMTFRPVKILRIFLKIFAFFSIPLRQ